MIFVNLYSCVPLHVEYIYIYIYSGKPFQRSFLNVISYIETTYP